MKPLETERLILREWKLEDASDLYEYARTELVGPNAGWKPHQTIDESRDIIKKFIENQDTYAIVLKESDKVIGSIGLHHHDIDETKKHLKQVILGYVLNPDYWGKGIMPEAVQRVLDYGFSELRVGLIWCGHFDFNQQSKRVIEKCGFSYQFNRPKFFESLNKEFEIYYYCIEKSN